MLCPVSNNCPVRNPRPRTADKNYNATCVMIDSGCSTSNTKCFGYVNCRGDACPDWQGVACFYVSAGPRASAPAARSGAGFPACSPLHAHTASEK